MTFTTLLAEYLDAAGELVDQVRNTLVEGRRATPNWNSPSTTEVEALPHLTEK